MKKEFIILLMVKDMKENFKMVKEKEQELNSMLAVVNIKVNGNMI